MLSVREKYWRYSLFVLIAGLGLTIFAELTPFLGGLLGAVTIYVLLRRQMWFLSERLSLIHILSGKIPEPNSPAF